MFPVAITADDIEDALGVPFATPEDAEHAARCAAAANSYVNQLDVVRDPAAVEQVQFGTVRLGARLFHTRPVGDLQVQDFDPSSLIGIDPWTSRLLRIGRFSRPVFA